MYAPGNARIDGLELGPLRADSLQVVARVHEVVHVRPHNPLVEPQVRVYLLLSVVDGVALLLSKDLVCELFLLLGQGMIGDDDADPDEVVSLRLRQLIQVAVQERRRLVGCLGRELSWLLACESVRQLMRHLDDPLARV